MLVTGSRAVIASAVENEVMLYPMKKLGTWHSVRGLNAVQTPPAIGWSPRSSAPALSRLTSLEGGVVALASLSRTPDLRLCEGPGRTWPSAATLSAQTPATARTLNPILGQYRFDVFIQSSCEPRRSRLFHGQT